MINEFRGPTRWLSNFHEAEVDWLGVNFSTNEHAFQAAKSLDPTDRVAISRLATPRLAKQAGRTLVLRPDWEAVKVNVMRYLTFQKFSRHPDLLVKLLATGDEELIEGNTWNDTFWGVCNGTGLNMLGILLMEARAALRTT